MRTLFEVSVSLLLCLASLGGNEPAAARGDRVSVGSYKLAPPEEVLERQARERQQRRRWIVGILVGSTFVAGAIGSWSRRRNRQVHPKQRAS